jgi:tetratricopeptide (TPR) repeat protein
MMLSIEERYRLIEDIEALHARLDYQGVVMLLKRIAEEALRNDIELTFWRALANFRLGRVEEAQRLVPGIVTSKSLAVDTRIGRQALNLYGCILLQEGKLAAAEVQFRSILEIGSTSGDSALKGAAYCNLGIIADIRMQWYDALALYKRSLAAYIDAGRPNWVALVHHNVGMTYRSIQHFDEADAHFAYALEYATTHELSDHTAYIELERALLISRVGDWRLAYNTANRAFRRAQIINHRFYMAEAERAMGTIANSAYQWPKAEHHLGRATQLVEDKQAPLLHAEVAEELAVMYSRREEFELAGAALRQAMRLYMAIGAIERAAAAEQRVATT